MDDKVTVAEICEHIEEERMLCACGRSCFDIPSANGEAQVFNLVGMSGENQYSLGPFVVITCRHCGEVKFLFLTAVRRSKKLRDEWKQSVSRKPADSRTEQSDEEAAAVSSAGDQP